MTPPSTINVLDQHGGVIAVTLSPRHLRDGNRWVKKWVEDSTVWRPGQLLRKTSIGELQEHDEKSFYQTNNDVTKALYKVPGYRFRIAVWFDNKTCERIA